MKYEKEIARLAYDGNYEKAITLLLEVVKEQDKIIQSYKEIKDDIEDCVNDYKIEKDPYSQE